MKRKILIVDDEHGVRESMRILLKNQYDITMAVNGQDAIGKFPIVQPDVVLLDLRLGDMNGIDVLSNVKGEDPDVPVVLITAYASLDTARKAVQLGAFDYISKPFDPIELENVVGRAIEHRVEQLEQSKAMCDLQSLRHEMEEAKQRMSLYVHDTIYALLSTLQIRDAYTGKHSIAVLWMVDRLARFMKLSDANRQRLKRAALVHDLGKIGIPEDILKRSEHLDGEDWDMMRQHPVLSAEIISKVTALSDLAPIVRAHHERWDGNGYPDGLAGESIPWEAQLLFICDTIHAMSGDRCYRLRLTVEEIAHELAIARGTQFKPELVDAVLASHIIHEIYAMESDGVMAITHEQIRQGLEEDWKSYN